MDLRVSCSMGYHGARVWGALVLLLLLAHSAHCAVDCKAPGAPANSWGLTCPSGTTYGKSCTFGCQTGYTKVGAGTMTCGLLGFWTVSGSCAVVDCKAPSTPGFATGLTCSGTTYGKSCTFGCQSGYTKVGAGTMTCGTDGLWAVSGSCAAVDCGTPSTPGFATGLTCSGTTYGKSCTFGCQSGYTKVGAGTLTCGANKLWAVSGSCSGLNIPGHCYDLITLLHPITGEPTPNHPLLLVERGVTVTTDSNGNFVIPNARIGEQITVKDAGFSGAGMGTGATVPNYTPTFTVTASGLQDVAPGQGIVVQEFPALVWNNVLRWLTQTRNYVKNPKVPTCVFLLTVTAKGKTYADAPQGVDGATVSISPAAGDAPYYFGVAFGKMTMLANPFNPRQVTSKDGGVIIPNVPVSAKPYTITASMAGYKFSSTTMYCSADGALVNAGPENGPTVL